MIPPNVPILIQEITKLPKPYPAFLNGSPILTEPRRNKVFRGSEVIEILQLYLEFLKFHPHALLSKTQVQLTQRDNEPVLLPPPAATASARAIVPEDEEEEPLAPTLFSGILPPAREPTLAAAPPSPLPLPQSPPRKKTRKAAIS